jgi:putative transposase
MIEPNPTLLSIRRQCELLGLNRAGYYYQPARESALNLELMRLIDEQYTKTPFYGWPRMTAHLRRAGYPINHKRVRRLMQMMCLTAIYPQPRPPKGGMAHKVYPYLLRNLEIIRPNQVWSTDITYIRMQCGFMYLAAIIDWYSRITFSWNAYGVRLNTNMCICTTMRRCRPWKAAWVATSLSTTKNALIRV